MQREKGKRAIKILRGLKERGQTAPRGGGGITTIPRHQGAPLARGEEGKKVGESVDPLSSKNGGISGVHKKNCGKG